MPRSGETQQDVSRDVDASQPQPQPLLPLSRSDYTVSSYDQSLNAAEDGTILPHYPPPVRTSYPYFFTREGHRIPMGDLKTNLHYIPSPYNPTNLSGSTIHSVMDISQ